MVVQYGSAGHIEHAGQRLWLWLKRHVHVLEWAGAVILGLALASVPVQLLYPAQRTLPYMSIGGLNVGGKDKSEVIAQLGDYAQNGQVKLASPSRSWEAKWQDVGLTIDPTATAEAALTYSTWERAIPLSSLVKVWQSKDIPMIALVDDDRLSAFAQKLVSEDKVAATNATITIKDGQVVVDPEKSGYQYQIDSVKSQVKRSAISVGGSITLVPEQVSPARSALMLSQLTQEAENILAHNLTLKVADKTYIPSRADIGSWISFADDPNTKQPSLQLNADNLRQYLVGIDKDIKIDPGVMTVTLLDGVEVARSGGSVGRTVAVDGTIAQIQVALKDQKPDVNVDLKIAEVPARVQYVRNYSQTSAGLLAIIKDWEYSAYGNYGVVVRELGGQHRYAEWQPDKQYVTASTFKMFVAYVLLTKLYNGEGKGTDITDIGWTVDACLEEMIVNSTNPCAVSLLNLMGWQNVQNAVEAAGFTGTLINNSVNEEKHSTVRDESNFLLKLYSGTLMDTGSTDRLLGYMKRQVWRSGIPSGVPKGVTVADKVGFYAGYIHDVAIVYAPKGDYILAVMSYGGSNPNIAELSKRVYNFFQN